MSDYSRQDTYSKQYSKNITFLIKEQEAVELLKVVGKFIKTKRRVLDIGCGVGVLASEIKKNYGSDVYGIDINEIAVKHANSSGIKAKVGDIEKKLPFNEGYFDIVLLIQVIEHVLDTDQLIIEARRVLKKDGLLIISTPNLANWFNRIIFLFGFQPFFTEVSLKDKTFGLNFTRRISNNRDTVGHIRIFTLKALVDFLVFYKFRMHYVGGGNLYYLPKYIKTIDKLFNRFPSLASDLIIVARK